MEHSVAVILGFVLFMLLGFGCGFALRGGAAWLALLVPVLFAGLTAFTSGASGQLLVRLAIALALTAASILAGRLLDRLLERRGAEV